MNISHKIEIKPNNKAITYFKKSFGCSRFAYNWALGKYKEYYEKGIKKSCLDLNKEFNAIKGEQYPFVLEVSKCVVQQPFLNLDKAFKKFFRDLKKSKLSYPKFKKKRENNGSFYLSNDVIKVEGKYLKIPKLKNKIKMVEELRFQGKINSVVISQNGNKYYASFSLEVDEQEYRKARKIKYNEGGVGIDVGLKSFVTLSNGLQVYFPKEKVVKQEKRIKRLSRQLDKKVHPKTKGDNTKKSNNYLKHSTILNKAHARVRNMRQDFLHKLTSVLVNNFKYIAVEKLNVAGMLKNHKLAKALSTVSFYEFKRMLSYKALFNHRELIEAEPFYPSSKTCSRCGHKRDLTLKDRVYICPSCGLEIDRDYNASINLFNLVKEKIGRVPPEYTPVDFAESVPLAKAMLSDLLVNRLVTSKVETGIQQKSYL